MIFRSIIKNNFNKVLKIYSKRHKSISEQNLVEIYINDQKMMVPAGITVMQAASMANIEIPRFCYHNKLSIAGNCRMCLVEVEKMPKPIASCAMPVMKGWRIHTDSDLAKKAREGVMELLLINHPLDCPICDQGGECDLQDQSMAHGGDRTRFIESSYSGKRAVENKDIGPLVATIMTRCIHCTRCVRFMSEIAGVEDLGTTGRGTEMEIGTYFTRPLESELSGNIIDVCPVGALTSKPDQFSVRPWEYKKFHSIDVSDAVGSNIVVGVRTSDIKRVLPNPNDEINEDWISDKARFMYDGLKYQRLMTPMVYEDGKFKSIGWEEALITVAKQWLKHKPENIFGIAGQLNDAESLLCLREMFHSFDCENLFTEDQDHPHLPTGIDFRCTYIMNNKIANIEECDAVVLVGVCPRFEAAMINARIRKALIHNAVKVYVVGDKIDATFPYEHVGYDIDSMSRFFGGKHSLSKGLTESQKPLIFVGTNMAGGSHGHKINQLCMKFANEHSVNKNIDSDWQIFNVIQRNAGYVNCLDLGFKSKLPSLKNAKFLYLLGTDGGKLQGKNIPSDCFVVYQGHHGDVGAQLANIILPAAAYTEKSSIYVNTEGRPQLTHQCVTPPGDSREDWKIIRALSDYLRNPLKYDNIDDVRARLSQIAPHFDQLGQFQPSNFQDVAVQLNSW